jgi:hypothetical protein
MRARLRYVLPLAGLLFVTPSDSIDEVINLNSIMSTGKDASYDAKQNKFSRRVAAMEKYETLKCRSWLEQAR